MASYKTERASGEIMREMSNIIRELKDPRISDTMLSIVNVHLTNDFSHCTIYVSALDGKDKAEKAIEGLKSASGYIKRELATRIDIRKMPELHFVADDGIEYGANLGKLMSDLNREKGQNED